MIGSVVSHYKILEKLGGGGMGVVYKALDLKLDRLVALKFLPPDLTRDVEARDRFIHEARAASALQHTNICVVHDVDETSDGQMFINMEYLEGETLKKKIERGPLRLDEAVGISVQVALGLAKAHKHGIVHRDVKPANVMLTADGVAKIVDFGLAKLTGSTAMTRPGAVLGTASYMSPEQIRGEPTDQGTDIWSLGVLLYEMISGQRPFAAEYENALMYLILNAGPVPITALCPDVPPELGRIIGKCMLKDQKERYRNVDEFIADLRSVYPALAPLPPRIHRIALIRERRSRALLMVCALILVALGAWFFLSKQPVEANQLRRRSIAVLPFIPYGRSFDDTVFADGMHDDILTQLSKISGLRVIARSSVVLYRDSKKTPRQIGDDLDVGYLLEGSTRRAGGKLRVTAQLIRTADEGHVWADNYDRNDADVFALQSDIAQRIASSMEAVLSPEEKASVEEIPTKSREAYSYYLLGNFYFENYWDSTGNAKAAELYEKAANMDPAFAQAYARIAVANDAIYGWDPTPTRLARITVALEKARALKPDDPIVHWAQGDYYLTLVTVHGLMDRLKLAEEEFQKALKGRPNWAHVHLGIGIVQEHEGLLREARESFRKYFSLSPKSLSGEWGWDPWTISSWLREWGAARKELDEYIARRPDDPFGYQLKAELLINGYGDLEGARASLEEGMRLPPNPYRDPNYFITPWNFWNVEFLEGKYQDALACLVELPHQNIGFTWVRWMRKGQTYMAFNQKLSAMACFDSALAFSERLPTGFSKYYRRGIGLAWRGWHDKAAIDLEKAGSFDAPWIQRKDLEEARAISAVLSKDSDRALNMIEQLLSQPGFLTTWRLRLDPVYSPLRNDPRFQAVVRTYGQM